MALCQANPCRVRRLADFVRRKDERSQVHLDYLGRRGFLRLGEESNREFGGASGKFRDLEIELVENPSGGVENFLIHLPVGGDGFEQRNGDDLVPAEGSHLTKLAAMDHIDGAESVPGSEDAVIGAGGTAALNVAKNDGS